MHKENRSCPCGQSTYTVRYFTNDWSGERSEWEMNCSECLLKYRLHEFTYFDSGLASQSFRWIKTEFYAKAHELRKESERIFRHVIDLTEKQYLATWVSFFRGKSKRAMWEILHKTFSYPSLSTFYMHTKNKAPEQFLKEYFTKDRIIQILGIIGIRDSQIEIDLKKANNLEIEAEELLKAKN